MSKIKLIELNDLPIQLIDGDRGVNYPSKSEFTNDGYCVFLNTGNVTKTGFDFSNIEFINEERDLLLRKGKLQFNDIVLTTRGTVGNVGFYHNKNTFKHIRINSGMIILRCDENKIYPYYLFLFLRSEIFKKQVLDQSSGSAQPQLPISSLKNISFPYYELETQQKIVKVLSDLDSKIELNNRINNELEAMAKTHYDYWFVQFDFPDTNGKPYKTSGGKMVWNAELKRDIPEGWEVKIVDVLLAKETTTTKIPSSEILEKGLIPVIDQSTNYIKGYTNDKTSLITTDKPRILFGDHTRILKLINFDFARGADGTQVLLSKNERMPQHLFFHSLLKIDLSNYGYARHFKFLKDAKIIIPSKKTATEFEEIVSGFYNKIKSNIFQNQELASLRDWLLPMLMNGQVSVGDVAEELGMVAEESERYGK